MATSDVGGPSPVPMSAVRISDSDRDAIVELLRRHTGEGRLSMEEFEERSSKAYAARTRGDVAGLLADLPPLDGPLPAAGAWAGGHPGWQPDPTWAPPLQPYARQRPTGPGMLPVRLHAARVRHLLWISLMLVAFWAISGAGFFWPAFFIVPVFVSNLASSRRPARPDRRHHD